jgi:hypothetical protein
MLITINVDRNSEAAQTRLLEGLEVWLQLGLLSDAQVRQICRNHLIEPLPPIPVSTTTEDSSGSWILESNVTPAEPTHSKSNPTPTPTRVREQQTLVPRLLQSFVAEISVIWLLFLGVFMVVVSSGVLAASQWQNFPPAGQYGILLAYTIAFWGASLWTGRNPRLQLTARMLAITTLLIVPVNFWMMDGLKVGQSAAGVGVMAIAAIILTSITLSLLRTNVGLPPAVNFHLTALNAIGLSWLHWGWNWDGVPLIVTYIGTVGTAFCLSYQLQQRDRQRTRLPESTPESNSEAEPRPAPFPDLFSLGTIAIAFSVLLLIGRAVFGAQVPLNQLGLAFGICGWQFCYLSRPIANRVIWNRVGAGLMLWGWVIVVSVQPPWQAIAVSGLGLWLLWDRFKANWRTADLIALLGVGLQAFWLLWFVVPDVWRNGVIEWVSALEGQSVDGAFLISVGGFPYVVLMLGLATWLRRQQQPGLAQDTEQLALTLGVLLTCLGFSVGVVRSLNLLLSAITLAVVTRRRPSAREFLIYLTHATWLAALISWIVYGQPDLSNRNWAILFLAIALLEWVFSMNSRYPLWRQSAWHLGLLVAALAYPELWLDQPDGYWSLLWLAVPVFLTVLGNHRNSFHPQVASWLTIPALLLQLPLVNSLNTLLIALGVATVLMLFSTQRLRHLVAAGLTVGFALGFVGALIWKFFSDQVTATVGLNLVAIAIFGLWLLRAWLRRDREHSLRRLYAQATDGWAIGLTALLLPTLSGFVLFFYIYPTATELFVGATLITTLAIAYRLWQQPNDIGFCVLAWSVELGVASLVALYEPSLVAVAIATLTLGFASQLAGDWRVRLSGQPYRTSWHAIPLAYAALGWVLSHNEFTASSGLYTFAAAIIWIGIGRRQPSLRPLTYLALLALSIGAYELLIYQLLQATGGKAGDGITLLAGLAALIAVCDRLLTRWLTPYLRIDSSELHGFAHLHWAVGTALAPLAIASSLSPTGANLWIGTMTILTLYALATANHRWASHGPPNQHPTPSTWTYAGILEALATLIYVLHRLIPDHILTTWGAAIACVVAIPMYYLPWEEWGWPLRPWRRSASILPAAIVVITSYAIALQTLLITGAFYAWLAKAMRQMRLSYISVFLLDWAILKYLTTQGWLEPIWISTILGCSVLYVVQIDPDLQEASDRDKRHLLRVLATGMICLTALYQAEIELQPLAIWFAILTLVLSVGLILLGLVLRVRAFLYVGTVTFIVRVLRLLWLFISTYSLLLWAVGIVIGLIFIWVAATFEARRSQVTAFVQYWATELEAWE